MSDAAQLRERIFGAISAGVGTFDELLAECDIEERHTLSNHLFKLKQAGRVCKDVDGAYTVDADKPVETPEPTNGSKSRRNNGSTPARRVTDKAPGDFVIVRRSALDDLLDAVKRLTA